MPKLATSPIHRSGAFLVIAFACATQPAPAQIPEEFTNLQILPEDIGRRELIDVMRGFASALSVRCNHCHVGERVDTLEDFAFADDSMDNKKVAREMMKMVSEINGTFLPATGREAPAEVTCFTCHRRLEKPQTLQDAVRAAIDEGGLEAGIARYRELREEHYGSAAYDFEGSALNSVAEGLFRDQEDLEGAIAMIRLNLEFNPEDTYSLLLLAQGQARQGDREAAIKTLEQALEIEPESQFLKNTLERLRSSSE